MIESETQIKNKIDKYTKAMGALGGFIKVFLPSLNVVKYGLLNN